MGTRNNPRKKGTGGLWIRQQKRWNEVKGDFELVELVQAAKEIKDPKNPAKRKWVTGTGRSADEAFKRLNKSLEKHLKKNVSLELGLPQSRPRKGSYLSTEDYLLNWHSEVSLQRVSPQLRTKYLQHLRNHIIPHIGEIPLRDLDYRHLTTLFEKTLVEKRKVKAGIETDEPLLGCNARLNIYKTLSISLKVAIKKGILERNPLELVSAPKYKQPQENVAQYMHLIEWLFKKLYEEDRDSYNHFVLALLGLRRGERLGLSFANVNVSSANPKINIKSQLSRISGQGLVINPSTKSGKDRIIALSEPWISSLKRLKAKRQHQQSLSGFTPEERFKDLVFLKDNGKPWDLNDDNEYWLAIQKKYFRTTQKIRGHALRHVAATAMAENGVDAEVAREILGHSSEAIGYYYRRISATKQRAQVDQFGSSWLGKTYDN
jgi:integrase